MKKLLLLALCALVLVGCTHDHPHTPDTTPDTQTEDTLTLNDPAFDSQKVIPQQVGDVCSQEQPCQSGLECFDGTCETIMIDDSIVCDKTKAVVCGAHPRGGQIEYLNECEARRHMAEILSQGFCPSSQS